MVKIINRKFINIFSKVFEMISEKEYNEFLDMTNIFEYILISIMDFDSRLTTGSVILRDDDGYFRYVAVKGHDMNILKDIRFKKNDIFEEKFYGAQIITSRIERETREQLDLLVKGGNLLKLKSYLSVPISTKNEVVGFLNIDNYSEKNIFIDGEIINIAKFFAKFMGHIYENINDKRDLRIKEKLLNKSNISNGILYNKAFLLGSLKEFFEKYEEFVFAIITIKNKLDEKSLESIFHRINKLFDEDIVAYEDNTFYILSEYISDYFFKTELKEVLEKPILWDTEIYPKFEYNFYNIPGDLKDIEEIKELI